MISHEFFEEFDKKPPISCPTCKFLLPISLAAVIQYYRRGQTKEDKEILRKKLMGEIKDDFDIVEEDEKLKPCCVETLWKHKRLF